MDATPSNSVKGSSSTTPTRVVELVGPRTSRALNGVKIDQLSPKPLSMPDVQSLGFFQLTQQCLRLSRVVPTTFKTSDDVTLAGDDLLALTNMVLHPSQVALYRRFVHRPVYHRTVLKKLVNALGLPHSSLSLPPSLVRHRLREPLCPRLTARLERN